MQGCKDFTQFVGSNAGNHGSKVIGEQRSRVATRSPVLGVWEGLHKMTPHKVRCHRGQIGGGFDF